jgi:hypothetical protein
MSTRYLNNFEPGTEFLDWNGKSWWIVAKNPKSDTFIAVNNNGQPSAFASDRMYQMPNLVEGYVLVVKDWNSYRFDRTVFEFEDSVKNILELDSKYVKYMKISTTVY